MRKTIELLAWLGERMGKPPGWERIVRFFAPPEKCRDIGQLCLVREGLIFLARPSVPLDWHVAFFGTYEPELRRVFRAVLPLGGVALDIGANVGWHTLLMARLVGDQGRVLAAEANPSVRRRLEDNLKVNRLQRVEVIPYAIADAQGVAEFYGPEADDAASGDGHVVMGGAEKQGRIIRVKTRSLDSLVSAAKLARLDLIKIDVEGFEWPALQGATQSIDRFRPHVVFEYISEYAARGGGTPGRIEEFFRCRGYRLFAIGRNWAEAVVPRNWLAGADIWAVPFD